MDRKEKEYKAIACQDLKIGSTINESGIKVFVTKIQLLYPQPGKSFEVLIEGNVLNSDTISLFRKTYEQGKEIQAEALGYGA